MKNIFTLVVGILILSSQVFGVGTEVPGHESKVRNVAIDMLSMLKEIPKKVILDDEEEKFFKKNLIKLHAALLRIKHNPSYPPAQRVCHSKAKKLVKACSKTESIPDGFAIYPLEDAEERVVHLFMGYELETHEAKELIEYFEKLIDMTSEYRHFSRIQHMHRIAENSFNLPRTVTPEEANCTLF